MRHDSLSIETLRHGVVCALASLLAILAAPACGEEDEVTTGTPDASATSDAEDPVTPTNADAAVKAGCRSDADCVIELPATTPVGCAEARCESERCVFRAKDADGDGDRALNCKAQAAGVTIETGTDCDDSSADVNTLPDETCDGKYNDCNGRVDDGVAPSTIPCTTELKGACEGKGVYVCAGGKYSKCNAVPKAQPISKKECDGTDWNCDGRVDTAGCACQPGQPIVCNQTCGGAITKPCNPDGTMPACDPGPQPGPYCSDADGDGYPGTCGTFCPSAAPGGWKPQAAFGANAGKPDCDDTTGTRRPDGAELCDGIDNNCNGMADEPQQSCNFCPAVTCGAACKPHCRPGFHFDALSGKCLVDAAQIDNLWNLSIGGAFACGLSYDQNYGGPCQNGRVRTSFSIGKTTGGNGHCEGTWASQDIHDCTVRVHFGTAWCDNFNCRIAIEAADAVNTCQ